MRRNISILYRVFSILYWVADASLGEIAALRHRMDKGSTLMLLSQLLHLFRAWRRYDASVQELYSLGDRELADIGITRSDIPRIAWDNART